jgi:hypothetical protein
MRQTLYLLDFLAAFRNSDRAEQFSTAALEVLYFYLVDMELDTGREIELDIPSLCCEFTEDTARDIAAEYSLVGNDTEILLHLNEIGALVGATSRETIVYRNF